MEQTGKIGHKSQSGFNSLLAAGESCKKTFQQMFVCPEQFDMPVSSYLWDDKVNLQARARRRRICNIFF